MDPLVITVASTNVKWTKKDSPYVPETPEEIAISIAAQLVATRAAQSGRP